MYILPVAILLFIMIFLVFPRRNALNRVSEFGKYRGYTENVYDGWKRTSEYLTMANGTRLAYDLFIPTKDRVPVNGPFPTLFMYTPYNRTWTVFDEDGDFLLDMPGVPWYFEFAMRVRKVIVPLVMPDGNGNLRDATTRTEWLGGMLKSGYAVVVVDRPGTGASFGTMTNDPDAIAGETDELLNWIADQAWCDGNIGMFGDSIQAQVQFQAASTGNPHLKAILPATTWMDNYSAVVFPGGVLNKAFQNVYIWVNTTFHKMATPVDSDTDGALLTQARAEREDKSALASAVKGIDEAPFRDVMTPDEQNLWIDHHTLYPLLEQINRSGIPVYLINGWYDIYARDNFMIYANLSVPKRLLVRPTDHSRIQAPGSDVDYAAEAHRWFDYWLKGTNNGIMDEPPIHYYLQGVDRKQRWQTSDVWPPANQDMIRYYLGAGEATSKVSANNGTLVFAMPTDAQAFDVYTVDYTTTTGPTPHWMAVGSSHKYPNLKSRDEKSLTYTTPPLATATSIIGHPVVHLWLSTGAPDLDAFAYLEDVDETGNATYVSQGTLRASHRTRDQAPFRNLGLPWYNHFESELQPIPAGEPFELVFDLLPTAYQFSEGNRIRITVAFADAGNFDTPILDPAPALKLLRNSDHPTCIELPVLSLPGADNDRGEAVWPFSGV